MKSCSNQRGWLRRAPASPTGRSYTRAAVADRRIRGSNRMSATYLRTERERGLQAAILCPVGFVCDHIEVLYDLDREAADVCRAVGLAMVRAEAVNADPQFLDMMADVVLRTIRRYGSGRPLPIVSA